MTGDSRKNQPHQPDRICGIDEVGRGPLAGPVTAAAVVLNGEPLPAGLRDSKTLSPRQRQSWESILHERNTPHGLGWVWPEEIDALNIHRATLLAMRRAWEDLCRRFPGVSSTVTEVFVDGLFCPDGIGRPCCAVPRGDSRIPAIMAAAIIAKTARDRWMIHYGREVDRRYGFEQHMGYPTAGHREALLRHGPCAIHRRSFRGVTVSGGDQRRF
jgi:ribonuclease HII